MGKTNKNNVKEVSLTNKKLLQSLKEAQQKSLVDKIRPTLFGSRGDYGDKGVNYNTYQGGKYKEAAERGNWSGAAGTVHNLEELADAEQGFWSGVGDIAVGGGKRFLAGALDSAATWDISQMTNQNWNKSFEEEGNWFQETAKSLIQSADENNKLYNDAPGSLWSWEYWGDQIQNTAYSLGIGAEILGENLALSALTSATMGGSAEIQALGLASKAKLFRNTTLGLNSMFSGVREAHMNARQTGTEIYDEIINSYKDDDYYKSNPEQLKALARQKAGIAASTNFKYEVGPLMILNGLQNMALIGTLGSKGKVFNQADKGLSLGISDFADSSLGKIVGIDNIKNETLRKVAGLGVSGFSEGIEEVGQSVSANYGKYVGLKDTKKEDFDFNPFDSKTRDEFIGGTLGGFLMGGLGKLARKTQNKEYTDSFDNNLETFINESTNRTNDIVRNIIGNQQKINDLDSKINNGDNNPVLVLEKLQLEKNVEELKRKSNLNNAITALQYDYLKGQGENAFNNHISSMQQVLDAVKNQDVKKLQDLNLIDENGNETFPGYISEVKKTFEKNINDSNKVKNILSNNLEYTTADFQMALEATDKDWQVLKKKEQRQNIIKEISDYNLKQLALKENGIENHTEDEFKYIDTILNTDNDNFSLDKFNESIKDLSFEHNNNLISSNVLNKHSQIVKLNKEISDLTKEAVNFKKPENIKTELEKRQKQELAKKIETVSTKDSAQSLIDNNTNPDSVIGSLITNTTVIDETNPNPKDFYEETALLPSDNENIKDIHKLIDEEIKNKESELADKAIESVLKQTDESVSYNMQLDKVSPELKSRLSDMVKLQYDHIKQSTGKKLGFSQFIEMNINQMGIEATEEAYNILKDTWQNLGYGEIKRDVYSKYFADYKLKKDLESNKQAILDEANRINRKEDKTVLTNEELSSKINQEQAPIVSIDKETGEVIRDKENVVIDKDNVLGDKKADAKTTIRINSISFSTDENGNRKDLDNSQIRQTDQYNLPYLLNPENIKTGDSVELYFENDVDESNFLTAPIMGKINGVEVGNILPDADWWNKSNIADLNQESTIETGRLTNDLIRRTILQNGNFKSTIERNNNCNKFVKLEQKESIALNNPNGMLIVKSKTGIAMSSNFTNYDKFDSSKSQILNDSDLELGRIYELRFVGKKQRQNGSWINTYFPVIVDTERLSSNEELINTINIIEKARAVILNPSKYSDSEKVIANRIKDGINKLYTGSKISFDISDGKGIENIRKGLSQQRRNTLENENIDPIESREIGIGFTMLGKPFPVVKEDGSVSNYKSEITGKTGYDAFLKDTLKTDIKGYSIQNENGEIVYITDVQPKIVINTESLGVIIPSTQTVIKEKKIDEKTEIIEEKINLSEQELDKVQEEISKQQVIINRIEFSSEEDILTSNEITDSVNFLFGNILGNLNVEDKISKSLIYEEHLLKSFDKYIVPKLEEYKELLNKLVVEEDINKVQNAINKLEILIKNKDLVLGINEFNKSGNNVKTYINKFFDTNIEEDIDSEIEFNSNILKDFNKESFQNNIVDSFSLGLKILFSNIVDTTQKSSNSFGFESYMLPSDVIGHLQSALSNLDNNYEVFKKQLENEILRKGSNKFYAQILDKLNNTSDKLRNEMLYKFNLSTLTMEYLSLKENKKGGYELKIMNANSNNPLIKLQRERKQQFKVSELINADGDTYKLNQNIFDEKIKSVYNTWVDFAHKNNGRYNQIPNQELIDYLYLFGINVEEQVIEKLKQDGFSSQYNDFNKNFTTSIFQKLYESAEKLINKQNADNNIVFKFDDDFIGKDNSSYIKSILEIQEDLLTDIDSSAYIAGKMINSHIQRNLTNSLIANLKYNDSELRKKLSETEYSKHSEVLNLLNTNETFRKLFAVSYMSLDAIKKAGDNASKELGLHQMTGNDLELYILGFLGHMNTNINSDWNEKGIKTKMGKMLFPTLSDTSQAFILNTIHYNLNLTNINVLNGEIQSLDDSVKELLISQLLVPELQRIVNSLDSSVNIKGYTEASKMLHNLPFMNAVVKQVNGNKITFLQYLHKTKNIQETLTVFKDEISNNIEKFIIQKSNDKYNSWLKSGIVEEKTTIKNIKEKSDRVVNGKTITTERNIKQSETKVIKAIIDDKYLKDKWLKDAKGNSLPNQSIKDAVKAVAVDNIVNNLINQANISMLITGDPALYSSNKLFSKFKNKDGNINLVSPIIENLKSKDNSNSVDSYSDDYYEKLTELYIEVSKGVSENENKRLKMFISPGNKLANSANQEYYQLIINDKELHSNTLESIINDIMYKDISEDSKKEVSSKIKELDYLQVKYEKSIEENQEKDIKLYETKIKAVKNWIKENYPKVENYLDINVADAQEYTTWKEHLYVLEGQGRLSSSERIMIYNIYDKLDSQSKNGITENNKLNDKEIELLYQPVKPLYAGDEFIQDSNGNQIRNLVYVKSSSFPLIPQFTTSFKLDSLRKNLEKIGDGLVRASYQSANKVGSLENGININRLYNEKLNSDEIIGFTKRLNRNNFYIQQDVPSHFAEDIKEGKNTENNRGTQMERIIFSEGLNKITDRIFDNIVDSDLLTIINESLPDEKKIEIEDKLTGKELYTIYNYLYEREQKLLKQILFNEYGNGNYVDKIESLQKRLIEKTNNPQDEEALELVYIKKLANGTIFKGSKQEFDNQFEKGWVADDAFFKIPLWLMPNSQKIEQYINSIVENKLLNLKLQGNSDVVASQEGFTKPTIIEDNTIDISKVIFTNNYDSEKGLQATHYSDGKLKSAQVITSSKFTKRVDYFEVINGQKIKKTKLEIINLEEYSDVIDGKRILRTYSQKEYDKAVSENNTALIRKIDNIKSVSDSLLQNFSYRIPSSSLQSGAIIEIVGFLPNESGDLLIVPKDHAVQIGEDYDIDKRYRYFNIHTIDRNKIREIQYSDVRNEIKQIESLVNNIKDNGELDTKLITTLYSSEEYDLNLEEWLNKTDEFKIADLQNQKAKKELKILKNNLTNIYKSIYTTEDKDVQSKINKVLSTDTAKNTATILDKYNSKKDIYFSKLDRDYQNEVIKLGASGKLGIGVHSNWVVLNSILQQLENPMKIPSFKFGNYNIDGEFGKLNPVLPEGDSWYQKNIDLFRSVSEINGENQNVATDNQKLQIMGKRNENKYTINVFALLSNLGVDMDFYIDEKGNKQPIQLSALFISQPILKRYVELKSESDSVDGDYLDNNKIKELLYKEFKISDLSFSNENDLTAKNLYTELQVPSSDMQKAVLDKFLELDEIAKEIEKIRSSLSFSRGLGKSYFQTQEQYKFLENIENIEFKHIQNYSQVYGDIQYPYSENEKNKLKEEGYLDFGNTYIKPNNITAMKILNTFHSSYTLWNDVLPMSNESVYDIVESILDSVKGKEKNRIETKYKILSSLQNFILTDNNLGILDKEVNTLRDELTKDTNENTSLARYLYNIKGNKIFNNNLLIKDFEYSFKDDNGLSLIKMNNNKSKDLLLKYKRYISFENMLSDTTELPLLNGEKMTVSKLAKKLIQYTQLIEQNQAVGFKQYIPVKYLDDVNFTTNIQKYNGNSLNITELQQERFIRQFFKNNVDLLISKKSLENKGNEKIDFTSSGNNLVITSLGDYYGQFADLPKYIQNTVKDFDTGVETKLLYRLNSDGNLYENIPFNKYIKYKFNSTLDIYETKIEDKKIIVQNNTEKELLPLVNQLTQNGNNKFLDLIKPFIDKNTKLIFTDNLPGRGLYISRTNNLEIVSDMLKSEMQVEELPFVLQNNAIYISSVIENKDYFSNVITEEIVHSITKDSLSKYISVSQTKYNGNGNITVKYLNDDIVPPKYVQDLVSLYRETVKQLSSKKGFEQLTKDILDKEGYAYPLTNFDEFVAGMLSNSDFINEIKNIKSGDTTIISKFAEAIRNLLKSISDSFGIENSILEKGTDLILQLMISEKAIQNVQNKITNEMKIDADKMNSELQEKGSQELDKKENNPKDFSNHSGGAKGGDTFWDLIGREFGVNNHNHYTTNYYDKLADNVKNLIEERYKNTVKFLGRGTLVASSYAGKLVRRDMIQAQNSDAIYGITELIAPGIKGRKGYSNKMKYSIPEGGTGYAVASGILKNKPTYVFNQSNEYGNEIGWYKWNNNVNDFVKVETPSLSYKYAGIGTTEINELGKQAIRDVYEKTFNYIDNNISKNDSNLTQEDIDSLPKKECK